MGPHDNSLVSESISCNINIIFKAERYAFKMPSFRDVLAWRSRK